VRKKSSTRRGPGPLVRTQSNLFHPPRDDRVYSLNRRELAVSPRKLFPASSFSANIHFAKQQFIGVFGKPVKRSNKQTL
jgi:hypothetical protein